MIIVNAILYSHPRCTVFYHLIIFWSLSYSIDLLRKITKILENMIFSLIFVLQKTLLPSIAENQENMIFTLIFTKASSTCVCYCIILLINSL